MPFICVGQPGPTRRRSPRLAEHPILALMAKLKATFRAQQLFDGNLFADDMVQRSTGRDGGIAEVRTPCSTTVWSSSLDAEAPLRNGETSGCCAGAQPVGRAELVDAEDGIRRSTRVLVAVICDTRLRTFDPSTGGGF